MVLPVLDYCDVAWHECGQDYFKLVASKLSTDQNYDQTELGTSLCRRRTHILRLVNECITNRVSRYFATEYV